VTALFRICGIELLGFLGDCDLFPNMTEGKGIEIRVRDLEMHDFSEPSGAVTLYAQESRWASKPTSPVERALNHHIVSIMYGLTGLDDQVPLAVYFDAVFCDVLCPIITCWLSLAQYCCDSETLRIVHQMICCLCMCFPDNDFVCYCTNYRIYEMIFISFQSSMADSFAVTSCVLL
jgi:uncharacterized membrane protein